MGDIKKLAQEHWDWVEGLFDYEIETSFNRMVRDEKNMVQFSSSSVSSLW